MLAPLPGTGAAFVRLAIQARVSRQKPGFTYCSYSAPLAPEFRKKQPVFWGYLHIFLGRPLLFPQSGLDFLGCRLGAAAGGRAGARGL